MRENDCDQKQPATISSMLSCDKTVWSYEPKANMVMQFKVSLGKHDSWEVK